MPLSRRLVLFAATLSCGHADGVSDIDAGGLTDAGTVAEGEWTTVHVMESGAVAVPRNFDGCVLDVLVTDDAQLAYRSDAVIVPAPGRFRITATAMGRRRFLRVRGCPSDPCYASGFSVVELVGDPPWALKEACLGRPDVEQFEGLLRPAWTITGLSPWQAGDELQAYSLTAGFANYIRTDPVTGEPPGPAPGDTAITGMTRSMDGRTRRVDASLGDRLTVHQLAAGVDAAYATWHVVAVCAVEPLTFPPSGDFDVSATCAAPATVATTTRAATAAYRDALAGQAFFFSETTYAEVMYLPHAETFGLYTRAWPTVAAVVPMDPQQNVDTALMVASLGSLTPPSLVVRAVRFVPMQAVGTTAINYVEAEAIGLHALTSEWEGPRIGPIDTFEIDGVDAASDVFGIGETPLVSWRAAPQDPSRIQYRVEVFEVVRRPMLDYTDILFVGSIVTRQSAVRIPDGVLATGRRYALRVSAEWMTDEGFVMAKANRVSGAVNP